MNIKIDSPLSSSSSSPSLSPQKNPTTITITATTFNPPPLPHGHCQPTTTVYAFVDSCPICEMILAFFDRLSLRKRQNIINLNSGPQSFF
ncbi:hypothetical protein HanRHA438_Chr05g0220071 [Helianthus annuus]|uniref:Uncharacterized protein n=1 Tax=Helianthus annuus TaxID=4232 RepID=A0A251UPR4_HELAN|nr:hypothetical protein HanIR_Chr05g0226591 [Helianthus annuus]KAJ0918621.1 hypothetical protein HanRHA438_Chr05g0220071 [Helianthus annuus]